MKKIITFIVFCVLTTATFSQDKTTIPPGPFERDYTRGDKIIFNETQDKFIKHINTMKQSCFQNASSSKASSDMFKLYVELVLREATEKDLCKAEIKCLFNNKTSITLLQNLLNNPAFPHELNRNTPNSETAEKVSKYYHQIINKYEHQE